MLQSVILIRVLTTKRKNRFIKIIELNLKYLYFQSKKIIEQNKEIIFRSKLLIYSIKSRIFYPPIGFNNLTALIILIDLKKQMPTLLFSWFLCKKQNIALNN